jgi:hypothetical protein
MKRFSSMSERCAEIFGLKAEATRARTMNHVASGFSRKLDAGRKFGVGREFGVSKIAAIGGAQETA